jgi:hypothetical protein
MSQKKCKYAKILTMDFILVGLTLTNDRLIFFLHKAVIAKEELIS